MTDTEAEAANLKDHALAQIAKVQACSDRLTPTVQQERIAEILTTANERLAALGAGLAAAPQPVNDPSGSGVADPVPLTSEPRVERADPVQEFASFIANQLDRR